MTYFKHDKFVQQIDADAFDVLHPPGAPAPYTGVFRCEGCGHRVTATARHPLPAADHHDHVASHGPIRWRMIVWA